jgi:RsmE family RNA methyltransferase
MNLLLFSPGERLEGNRIRLQDHRLDHLRNVIKASEGDSLRVGEIGGQMGLGRLLELRPDEAILEFELTEQAPAKIPVTLVLALPRPKMLRRILRMVAEFGVAELHLINSYRVEKSYWQSLVLEPDTVAEYFIQGLEQARDTVLPRLHLHKRFKPFVEDDLPGLLDGNRALVAHPGDYPLCPGTDPGQHTVLVIGPEGGFIPYEIEKLESAGCTAVSLGPRILRVENAVSSLLSRLG